MKNLWKSYLASFLFLFCSIASFGTHIRGGMISAVKLNNLEFEFTFIGYRDRGSTIPFGGGNFDFGDGNVVENVAENITISTIPLSEDIDKIEFKIVHKYTEKGTYTVSYEEEYRNDDIVNMTNSVVTNFYVETSFLTEFANTTPLPKGELFAPFYMGEFGLRDFQFVDNDGDELRYYLRVPRQSRLRRVNNYRYPDHPDFYSKFSSGNSSQDGEPVFSLNKLTGTLVWNAPGDIIIDGVREYAVAFNVVEFRVIDGVRTNISTTTVDIQLIVFEPFKEQMQVILEKTDFCTDGEAPLMFEVRSNDMYTVKAGPSHVISSINGYSVNEIGDSIFSEDSRFEVLLNASEEEQFVSFLISSVNEAEDSIFSSFTYLISENCDRYLISSISDNRDNRLIFYPNPARDEIRVQNVRKNMKYTILSMEGRTVKYGDLGSSSNNNGKEISLVGLENGTYIIQFYYDSEQKLRQIYSSSRLIVQK